MNSSFPKTYEYKIEFKWTSAFVVVLIAVGAVFMLVETLKGDHRFVFFGSKMDGLPGLVSRVIVCVGGLMLPFLFAFMHRRQKREPMQVTLSEDNIEIPQFFGPSRHTVPYIEIEKLQVQNSIGAVILTITHKGKQKHINKSGLPNQESFDEIARIVHDKVAESRMPPQIGSQ